MMIKITIRKNEFLYKYVKRDQRVIEFCGTDLKKVVDELGGEEFCPGFLLKGKDPRKVGTEVECPSDVVLIENLVKALPKFK